MAGSSHILLMRFLNHQHVGTTLVEFLLFLGILAFVGAAMIFMLLSSEDTRVRQHAIAQFEQNGARTIQLFTRSIRNAEAILQPSAGQTGSILTLQMTLENEHATTFAESASGQLIMAQRTTVSYFLPEDVIMKNLTFRNAAGTTAKNVLFSFDLETIIPLPQPIVYTKHFQGSATLSPNDDPQAGGCNACTTVSCVSNDYRWPYCASGVCRTGSGAVSC